MIGERTKAGLAAKKAKEPEWLPGNRTNLEEAHRKASDAKKEAARKFADRVRPEIERMQASYEPEQDCCPSENNACSDRTWRVMDGQGR